MARNEIHVGDTLTAFTARIMDDKIPVDVSDAVEIYLIFEKPSGETMTKTAEFVYDGSDGRIRYITAEGDLDEAGQWYIQARLVGPPAHAYDRHSERKRFIVYRNIG